MPNLTQRAADRQRRPLEVEDHLDAEDDRLHSSLSAPKPRFRVIRNIAYRTGNGVVRLCRSSKLQHAATIFVCSAPFAFLGDNAVIIIIGLTWIALFLELLFLTDPGAVLLKKHKYITYTSHAVFLIGLVLFLNRVCDNTFHDLPTLRFPTIPADLQKLASANHTGSESIFSRFKAAITEHPDLQYEQSDNFSYDFSIIIAARDEEDYITKTIRYTLENTPASVVTEILIVDDASSLPLEKVLNDELTNAEKSFVKVIRFDEPQGLIRARIAGADASMSDNLFFLDGHCKPKKGWHRPLLDHLKSNYKRVACPIIQDIHRGSWEDVGTQGSKMMFSWNFEFDWYDDLDDEVPVSAGGILAITRQWWIESGKYDPGMREWGGENLEQSMRTWMCGGEIVVARNSFVGHIFDRPAKPNPGGALVKQVQINQKRAALVWLDDYYPYFESMHSVVKSLDEGPGLEQRLQLRRDLRCNSFEWYVNRFRTAFERKGMLLHHFHHIQHGPSGWCLTAVGKAKKPGSLALKPCITDEKDQRWQAVAGGRMLYNEKTEMCIDRASKGLGEAPILYGCDFTGIFQMLNQQQFWLMSQDRLFYTPDISYSTPNGNDYLTFDASLARAETSLCLSSAFKGSADELEAARRKSQYVNTDIIMVSCAADDAGSTWKWAW